MLPFIKVVLSDGQNSNIIALGSAFSGKTYTLEGTISE